MTNRILKRHKRQVARAKQRVQLSEPDLRTPEQVRAAREASRPDVSRRNPATVYPRKSSSVSGSEPVSTNSEKESD